MRLSNRLWQHLIRGKTVNQLKVLKKRQLNSPQLEMAVKQDSFDEGNCARRYWQLYFPSIGWVSSSHDRKHDNAPNKMLIYGYAVLAALCHRGLPSYCN